jgi:uncharacterized protein (DUF885 family)
MIPALTRYRDFLQNEYLAAAREAVGVSANPNGAACYDASVRYFSSLPRTAKEVHATGLEQVARLDAEMKAIGERSFGTGDVPKLLERIRTGKPYLVQDREQLIGYSQAALARSKARVRDWFGLLPAADVVIQPYPKFARRAARTNTTRRPRTEAGRPCSSSTRTRPKPRAARSQSRPRFTKRFPAIISRARSRSSGRRSIPSGVT